MQEIGDDKCQKQEELKQMISAAVEKIYERVGHSNPILLKPLPMMKYTLIKTLPSGIQTDETIIMYLSLISSNAENFAFITGIGRMHTQKDGVRRLGRPE